MYIIVFVDTKNRRLQMTNLTELETAMVEKMGAESSYEDAECTKCDNTCFLALHEMGDPRVARGVFASLSQKGLTFTWDNSDNGDPRFNTLYGLTDDGIDVYFNLIKGKGE